MIPLKNLCHLTTHHQDLAQDMLDHQLQNLPSATYNLDRKQMTDSCTLKTQSLPHLIDGTLAGTLVYKIVSTNF